MEFGLSYRSLQDILYNSCTHVLKTKGCYASFNIIYTSIKTKRKITRLILLYNKIEGSLGKKNTNQIVCFQTRTKKEDFSRKNSIYVKKLRISLFFLSIYFFFQIFVGVLIIMRSIQIILNLD